MIARPLARLTAVTRRIARATGPSARPPRASPSSSASARDFNEMADAVQRDLAAGAPPRREARDAEQRLQTIADRVPGAVFQFSVDADGALTARFFSRGGEHVDFRSFAAQASSPTTAATGSTAMLEAAHDGGAWHHEYRVHAERGGIAWMEAQALPPPRRPASSTATSPTSPNARRSRPSCAARARRPRPPTARSRASWPRSATSCARRWSPSPARSTSSRTTALTAEQRDLTEIALRSARSLLALIGDVLDFSKIEAGHLDIVPAPVDVGALARGPRRASTARRPRQGPRR